MAASGTLILFKIWIDIRYKNCVNRILFRPAAAFAFHAIRVPARVLESRKFIMMQFMKCWQHVWHSFFLTLSDWRGLFEKSLFYY